jgi:predicted GIY-YIG superfamily endonuclease
MNKFDERENITVYCIECVTPNHFYVGQSGNFKDRFRRHKKGTAHPFTAKHGVKNLLMQTVAPTRNIALYVEELLFQVLKSKGVTVGYYERKAR